MKHEIHRWTSLPEQTKFTCQFDKKWVAERLAELKNNKNLLVNPNEIIIQTNTLPEFDAIFQNIKTNPGFVLIQFGENLNDQELRLLYAFISRGIGTINDRYGYFFDVVDQGLDYTKEVIPVSKTSSSTGYHTDSTAKEYFPDIVGLLCLQPGHKGGASQITNAADVFEYIQDNFPQALIELLKPVIRDVITPGTINNYEAIRKNAFPIFSLDDDRFTFRYMRYWIESAHLKTNVNLSEALLSGLNAIDVFFAKPQNTIEFLMKRGDMLFLNNRFLCHNRTEFENDISSSHVRKLVRTWVNFEK